MPFEEAMRRLEEVVKALEAENLPLEKMLGLYEEGVKLTHDCQRKLQEAELQVRRLEQTLAGELKAVKASGPEGMA